MDVDMGVLECVMELGEAEEEEQLSGLTNTLRASPVLLENVTRALQSVESYHQHI